MFLHHKCNIFSANFAKKITALRQDNFFLPKYLFLHGRICGNIVCHYLIINHFNIAPSHFFRANGFHHGKTLVHA